MISLFIKVINMSICAGYAALFVMLIRLFIGIAPKKYSYMLWAVVFFRLVCPFTINLPINIIPVQPQTIPQAIICDEIVAIQNEVPVFDNGINNDIKNTCSLFCPAVNANPVQILFEAGAYIWLAGFISFFLYGVISYLRLKRKVSTAILVLGNVYETDLIKSPFVLGFINPKVYTPIELSEKEIVSIIAHEMTHIRRFDYLIKPLTFLIVSVHWFNPLAWISYSLMARDMELSADENVMSHSDADIRGEYSKSLLSFSARRSGLLNPPAFGEIGIKDRVKNVLHYKKASFGMNMVTFTIVIVVSILLVGGNVMTNNDDGNTPSAIDTHWRLGYIPEGYDELVYLDEGPYTTNQNYIDNDGNIVFLGDGPSSTNISYINADGEQLYFDVMPGNLPLNQEDGADSKITIDGVTYLTYPSTGVKRMSRAMWEKDGYQLCVMVDLPLDEIIKIVRSVSLEKQ